MNDRIYWDLCETYQNLYNQVEDDYEDDLEYFEEEIDYFDSILEYLLDEGYAEDYDSAYVIMANMSEEWRDNILYEALKKTDTTTRSEQEAELKNVNEQIRTLQAKQRTPKGLTPEENIKLAKLGKRASTLRKSISQLLDIFDQTRSETKKKSPEEKSAPLTPKDREDLRSTRTRVPSGTPQQRAARLQAAAERGAPKRGQSPASGSSGTMNVNRPGDQETKEQERRGKAAEGILGDYGTPTNAFTGRPLELNSLGRPVQIRTDATRSERSSGASGDIRRPNVTGVGVRGSTQRQPRTRGTGRRPSSQG